MDAIKKSLIHISMVNLVTLLIAGCGMKWPILLALIAIVVQDIILFLLYLYAQKTENSFYFRMGSICIWGLAFMTIQIASYKQNISWMKWLILLIQGEYHSVWGYELGTLLAINYILTCIGIGREFLRRSIEKQINRWLPVSLLMLIVMYIAFFTRGELSRKMKLIITIGSLGIFILLSILQEVQSMRRYETYVISNRGYIKLFLIFGVMLVAVLNIWPIEKDLPGTSWVQGQIEMLGYINHEHRKQIPDKRPITEVNSLSSDVLFEVTAQEPLYLREIAYSHYESSEWYIPKENHVLVPFKPVYLEAEYKQLDWLLEEIEWIRAQDKDLLIEYADLFEYSKAQVEEKSFYIVSGPRVVSNYYTVNGITKIKSDYEKNIYYYHILDNIYFRCNLPKSNVAYSVTYYNRVPQEGTREYYFLKQINAQKWKKLYRVIEGIKGWYNYEGRPDPTLLAIYTPLKQYEAAQKDFMNVPEDLKARLEALALTITNANNSDWDQAQQIEAYLKGGQVLTYNLEAKRENLAVDRVYEFLFESKEGICQDFATSMVLMCRSIGLPARYITGYLVTEQDIKTGEYIVRKKDAHAFVEVYIAGFGWMPFDPTPVTQDEKYNMQGYLLAMKQWMQGNNLVVGLMILVVILSVVIKMNYEYIWLAQVVKKPPHEVICLLIKRGLWHLELRGLGKLQGETLRQYENRLNSYHLTMGAMIDSYSDYKYGNKIPSKSQINESLEAYKVLYKKIKSGRIRKIE